MRVYKSFGGRNLFINASNVIDFSKSFCDVHWQGESKVHIAYCAHTYINNAQVLQID